MRKRLKDCFAEGHKDVSVPLRGIDMRKRLKVCFAEVHKYVSVPLRGLDMRKREPPNAPRTAASSFSPLAGIRYAETLFSWR